MKRSLAPLALAVLALAAAPAAARAPTASEEQSLDWVLQRLARDREEDRAAASKVDPITAFQSGQSPLEEWKTMAAAIEDPRNKLIQRERATTAIIERFKWEEAQGKTDAKTLDAAKKAVCNKLLRLMLENDEPSRQHIHRLLANLQPQANVKWAVADPASKRRKAYEDLVKKLK